MKAKSLKIKPYLPKETLQKGYADAREAAPWILKDPEGNTYTWTNTMERVQVIRQGVTYGSIEVISERLNRPVKAILSIIGIPQTTYNKKKSEHAALAPRDSELIILLTELIDYGLMVFNDEEAKFQRWLEKPNLSLGGQSPDSLLDTVTGIEEVTACLQRIEHGIFA